MRWVFVILVSVCFGFTGQRDLDWVDPLDIDLEKLNALVLSQINERRIARGGDALVVDDEWSLLTNGCAEEFGKRKITSNTKYLVKRINKYTKLKRSNFSVVEKWFTAGVASAVSCKYRSGSYFLDTTLSEDYSFFYGYKSQYEGSDGPQPNPVHKKTYEELAKEIINNLSRSTKGDLFRKEVSKIGIKSLTSQKRKNGIPVVKFFIHLACNTTSLLLK